MKKKADGQKICTIFFLPSTTKGKEGLLKIPRADFEEVWSDEAKGRREQLAVKRAGRCMMVVEGAEQDINFPAETHPKLLFPTM